MLGPDLVGREEVLRGDDRAEPPRPRLHRVAVADQRELHRAAADVERQSVGERGRVDGGEVAVAGLLLAGEDLDVEAGALLRGAHELGPVARLPDRGGGERADVLDPRRSAEVREELDRLQRALHRLGLQRPALLLPFADAHGLVDLVRALPPLRGVGEDDQAEAVRAEVDDGEPALHAAEPTRHRGRIGARCRLDRDMRGFPDTDLLIARLADDEWASSPLAAARDRAQPDAIDRRRGRGGCAAAPRRLCRRPPALRPEAYRLAASSRAAAHRASSSARRMPPGSR